MSCINSPIKQNENNIEEGITKSSIETTIKLNANIYINDK